MPACAQGQKLEITSHGRVSSCIDHLRVTNVYVRTDLNTKAYTGSNLSKFQNFNRRLLLFKLFVFDLSCALTINHRLIPFFLLVDQSAFVIKKFPQAIFHHKFLPFITHHELFQETFDFNNPIHITFTRLFAINPFRRLH